MLTCLILCAKRLRAIAAASFEEPPMGQQIVHAVIDPERRRRFVKDVLADLRALDRMIADDRFEKGVRRIGAEQEFVLVDECWRPAPVALELLDALADDRFTTELSLYNVEYNAAPLVFEGRCLSRLEGRMQEAVARVATAAEALGARPILTGILPTLRKADLGLAHITPRPRYTALVNAYRELRGDDYEFRFTGIDELIMRHESVMLEACNTSAQFHFQVAPDEFATLYNAAQVSAGPVLAAAVNSPLLFGKRLWQETRVALFQQAVDTRRPIHAFEERSARVRFGEDWVRRSAVELFQEDVTRLRVLLAEDVDEDPLAVLAEGRMPRLKALQLHNSTVYRWNRACFGVSDGVPHLRIENRLLPSGPTVADEVANAAFWFGLIAGIVERWGNVADAVDFDDARSNMLLAARLGLDARLSWIDGVTGPAASMIAEIFLPLAADGLRGCGIDETDIERYLGIIERRVALGRTGARWLLDTFDALKAERTRCQRLDALVEHLWRRQQAGRPVHEWEPIAETMEHIAVESYLRVDHFMTTDVFTVREDDVIDLAASIMDWKHVLHVPVENAARELVGLVTYRKLLRFLAQDLPHGRAHPVPVNEVMVRDPITVTPETSTLDAMHIMKEKNVPCLPVVRDKRLVGLLNERDFIPIASRLLEERLQRT